MQQTMCKKIFSYVIALLIGISLWIWGIWWMFAYADWGSEKWGGECDWIKLNTCFPIIWDCIQIKKTEGWTDVTKAFPTMIWALTKIIISIILVVCFIMIIVAWIMRASSWDKAPTKAKWLIIKVAVTILLLWFSWVILKLINPNFFS